MSFITQPRYPGSRSEILDETPEKAVGILRKSRQCLRTVLSNSVLARESLFLVVIAISRSRTQLHSLSVQLLRGRLQGMFNETMNGANITVINRCGLRALGALSEIMACNNLVLRASALVGGFRLSPARWPRERIFFRSARLFISHRDPVQSPIA